MTSHGLAALPLVAGALLLTVSTALAASFPAAEPIPPPTARVTELLNQLNAPAFAAREAASKELMDLVMDNRLSVPQLGLIRTFAGMGELEGRRRAEAVIQKWTTTALAMTVKRTVESVEVFKVLDLDGDFIYKFDGFFGLSEEDGKAFAGLDRRYEAARNALTAGDTTKIVETLTAIKTYVDNDQRFKALALSKDREQRQEATRQEVVAKIQEAIDQAAAAIDDIGRGSGNVNPAPREKMPVNGRGDAGTGPGQTLRLFFAFAPIVPGGLDVFMPLYELALFPPPPGYQFVGNIFDLLADDALDVTGEIAVGIEYGPGGLLGNPVGDPRALRIARLANGRADILENFSNDTTNFVITGFYVPESLPLGLDQFGEFAIVQFVPAPASLILVAAACAVFYARRRGRR